MDVKFNCPECGKEITCDPSMVCLCYHCGEEVEVPSNATKIESSDQNRESSEYICSKCAAPVSLTDRVCPNCGDILEEDEFTIPELRGMSHHALVEIREPRRDVLLASLFSATHGFLVINGTRTGRLPIVVARECIERLIGEGWKLVTVTEYLDGWWNVKQTYYGMSGGKYQFKLTPRNPLEFEEAAKKAASSSSSCGGYIAKGFGAIGLIITLGIAAGQIAAYGSPSSSEQPVLAHISAWIVIAAGLVVSGYMLWNGYKAQQQGEQLAAFWMTNEESIKLSKELNSILENSEDLVLNKLPSYLQVALSFLDQAERNYLENAFGSFWDSIENAAQAIADFYKSIQDLNRKAEVYTQKLLDRQHNFPPFFLPRSIPDPNLVLTRFNAIIQRGQTNFQFASIWEQRKTRHAVIKGFVTLDEAVTNLISSVEFSMQELQKRIL